MFSLYSVASWIRQSRTANCSNNSDNLPYFLIFWEGNYSHRGMLPPFYLVSEWLSHAITTSNATLLWFHRQQASSSMHLMAYICSFETKISLPPTREREREKTNWNCNFTVANPLQQGAVLQGTKWDHVIASLLTKAKMLDYYHSKWYQYYKIKKKNKRLRKTKIPSMTPLANKLFM